MTPPCASRWISLSVAYLWQNMRTRMWWWSWRSCSWWWWRWIWWWRWPVLPELEDARNSPGLFPTPLFMSVCHDHIDTIYVQVRKVLNSYVFMFRQANDHNHLLTNLTIWWLSSIARIKVVPDLGWPPMMVMMMKMAMVMSMDGTVDI